MARLFVAVVVLSMAALVFSETTMVMTTPMAESSFNATESTNASFGSADLGASNLTSVEPENATTIQPAFGQAELSSSSSSAAHTTTLLPTTMLPTTLLAESTLLPTTLLPTTLLAESTEAELSNSTMLPTTLLAESTNASFGEAEFSTQSPVEENNMTATTQNATFGDAELESNLTSVAPGVEVTGTSPAPVETLNATDASNATSVKSSFGNAENGDDEVGTRKPSRLNERTTKKSSDEDEDEDDETTTKPKRTTYADDIEEASKRIRTTTESGEESTTPRKVGTTTESYEEDGTTVGSTRKGTSSEGQSTVAPVKVAPSEHAAKIEKLRERCLDSKTQIFADPDKKCSPVFYQCSYNSLYKHVCNFREVFDPESSRCTYYANVADCKF